MPTYVPTYPLQIYIRAYLPITDLPTYLPTIADLHTYLPTYLLQIYIPIADLPTQLHTYCRSTDRLMSGISPNSSGKSLKERIHYTLLVNDVPSWNDILVGRHLSNMKSFQIWEHLGHWLSLNGLLQVHSCHRNNRLSVIQFTERVIQVVVNLRIVIFGANIVEAFMVPILN